MVLFGSICTIINISEPKQSHSDNFNIGTNDPNYQAVVLDWGKIGARSENMNRPSAMTIDGKDRIYVCDSINHRINEYNTNGILLRSWGSYGTLEGQFNMPQGIAYYKSLDRLYISDSKNNRVQIFDVKTGRFISQFSILGEPSGIILDKQGNVYVADRIYNWIWKYTTNGEMELFHWGAPNANPSSKIGEFDNPTSLSIDSDDNIYVCDSFNNRIQVFDQWGNYLRSFGSLGKGNGQFQNPYGVYVSSNNLVYVTDFWGNRIQVFNNLGVFQFKWGTEGTEFGSIKQPVSVAIDIQQYVYVLEFGNNRVQKFFIDQDFKTYPGDLAVSPNNQIYYLDSNAAVVRKYNGTTMQPVMNIGGRGIDNGTFINPIALELDSNGSIYVLDDLTGKITIFDINGTFITYYGGSTEYENKSLSIPQDFTISSTGDLYITDSGNDRIIVLNSTGHFKRAIGEHGYGQGFFNRPVSITSNADYLYILDETGRIQILSFSGTYIAEWGRIGTAPHNIGFPAKIKCLDNNVYLVNSFSHRIQKYSTQGNHEITIGSRGSNLGQFERPSGIDRLPNGKIIIADTYNFRFQILNNTDEIEAQYSIGNVNSNLVTMPYGVAYDAINEEIYVSDILSHCIRIYNKLGNYNRTIGQFGSGTLQFNTPMGITYDLATQRIYIVDRGNSRIVVLKNGEFQNSFTLQELGGFDSPCDIAVNSSGDIYVTDTGNNRIVVFNTTYNAIFTITGFYSSPMGIHISPFDEIYIADYGSSRIIQINWIGQIMRTIGNGTGSDSNELDRPMDITTNDVDEIIVTDSGNNRVSFFNLAGENVNIYGTYGSIAGRFQQPTQITFISGTIFAVADRGNLRLQILNEADLAIFSAPILNSITNPNINGNITLSWNEVVDAEYYYVYRTTYDFITDNNIQLLEPLAMTSNTSYFDYNLPNGTYYYAIVAGNRQQNSSVSNSIEVIVAIPGIPPEGKDKIGVPLGLPFFIAVMIGLYVTKRKVRT
jgi:sugar lactone lactonase YvrE